MIVPFDTGNYLCKQKVSEAASVSTQRGAGTQTRSVAFSTALDTISQLTDNRLFEETRALLYRPNYSEISNKRLGDVHILLALNWEEVRK